MACFTSVVVDGAGRRFCDRPRDNGCELQMEGQGWGVADLLRGDLAGKQQAASQRLYWDEMMRACVRIAVFVLVGLVSEPALSAAPAEAVGGVDKEVRPLLEKYWF